MTQEVDIEKILSALTFEEKVSMLNGADLWHSQAIPRLGIPALKVTDGPNGVRGEARDTAEITSASFPVGTAMGATWNPELIHEIGEALAEEVKAKKAHVLLGPTVNTHRAPLAGRNFECFSEDPCLSAEMVKGYIQGVQSKGVGACVKHFACNDQEYERFSISAEVPQRALHEIYLPAFKAAVTQAKSWTIMSAYNRINGTYASENDELLLNILKDDWGFDGLVISDWYGTYSEKVLQSGLDLEMPGPARWFGEKVHQYVRTASAEDAAKVKKWVDEKVRRLLRTLVRTGSFQNGGDTSEQAADKPEHRSLIRRAGAEAIVLLKNQSNLLPIKPQGQKLAVIGVNAKKVAFQGGGSSQVNPHYVISPLDAIEQRVGSNAQVTYALGCPVHKYIPELERSWLVDSHGKAGGWTTVYYNNPDFSGEPVHEGMALGSSISWFGETAPYFDPAYFSVRMLGSFQVPVTGQYQFSFTAIGKATWQMDGKNLAVFDGTANENHFENKQITLPLEASRVYQVVIEFSSLPGVRWRTVGLGCLPPLPEDPIGEAVSLAKEANQVIIVAGLTQEWEGEGFDRESMDLPGQQNELIARVAAANPKTIVVLNTGSPVHMPWIEAVSAVVQMWYLGQEIGNALADVLFGDVSPSGKLPTTFPKRIEDNPSYINFPGENGVVRYGEGIFVGYRYYDHKRVEPLFPFGHGLSYTHFEYGPLEVERSEFSANEGLRFSLTLKNTGPVSGAEVVQVYIHDETASLVRPPKELKAFRKVFLDPGQQTKLTFVLTVEDLSFYHDAQKTWMAEPGVFTVLVGSSSKDIRLTKQVHLLAE